MIERDASLPYRRARGHATGVAWVLAVAGLLLAALGPGVVAGWTPRGPAIVGETAEEPAGHLVVSEVMAGGASASDEFIELYNPTAAEMPLEGLELVYVSASGATVSRKAAWSAGAVGIAPGAHVLVANETGIFAPLADLTYATGLAASGGSVALRIQGASTAIDAVGWGTAASTWLEGSPAVAVPAGHSLERLPGGADGSGQDTDDNAVDFVDQEAPDPQNAAAPPIVVSPSAEPSPTLTVAPTPSTTPSPQATAPASVPPLATATPSPTATPTPTPTGTPSPTPTPSAAPSLTIADARALPDGADATVEGVSLTDGSFTDGGGCIADLTAGIAVLVDAGTYPRGYRVRATGVVDDRYHQRTLRTDASRLVVLEAAAEPDAMPIATGSAGEPIECQLAVVNAEIVSSATRLSGATAYDVDDGSGPLRVLVPDAAGLDLTAWTRGAQIQVRGVVGQRDSSGTGTAGYRLQLRDPDDLLAMHPPTASPDPSSSPSASASPSPDASVVTIAVARQAPLNARVRVRGVVTLPTGVLGDGTAAIQDASGSIILRLGDEVGSLSLGELVQVDGMRSTKSGMETIRVSAPPRRLGTQAQPEPGRHATGALGEAEEAKLVLARGAISTTPRRSSAQNVYFDLDDGSGPLRVYVTPGSEIDATGLGVGAWVEITGVLGQETSGQQPQRGYRLWPRRPADVRVVSPPTAAGPTGDGGETGPGSASGHAGPGGDGMAPDAAERALARWPAEIPVPRLAVAAHRLGASPRLVPSLDPAPMSATQRPAEALSLVLVLVAALASTAAVAVARPGLVARLRLALVATTPGEAPGAPAGRQAAAGQAEPDVPPGPRLDPIAIHEEPSSAEHAASAESRSAVRRILPPT